MKLAPYPKYKPSGVEWLGEVPEHWITWKATHGFRRIGSGTTPKSDDSEYYDGNIPWVTTSELRETVITNTTKKVTATAMHEYPMLRTYPKGTLLFAMYGATIGRLGILGVVATVNQACAALAEPLHLDTWFVYYWLQMRRTILIVLSAGGGQPNLSQDDLRRLRIPAPQLDEQRAIANFLDRETAKIDVMVAKKRTLIERLKEKRTALISRTVTRGLPPNDARAAGLDPHPKLKPTGIDWLGEVPEHWAVKAIKRESTVLRGASPRPIDNEIYFDEEGEYAWVRIADVSAAGMYLRETTQQLSDLGQSLSVSLEPGSLFLSIAGTVGKPCITGIKCCIHDGFVYFPSWRSESRFLYYLFASGEPYKGLGKLGTQLNLNTDTVGSIVVGFPALAEQQAIADFLDHETDKLDAMVAKIETAIERLQEYRTVLITAAVTGKIDVRESAA